MYNICVYNAAGCTLTYTTLSCGYFPYSLHIGISYVPFQNVVFKINRFGAQYLLKVLNLAVVCHHTANCSMHSCQMIWGALATS